MPKTRTTGKTASDILSRGVGRKGVFRAVYEVIVGIDAVGIPLALGEDAGFAARRSVAILVGEEDSRTKELCRYCMKTYKG